MANNREALALELKQIIQADRMADDIIKDAENTKKNIEKATEKQKAALLAGALRQKQELEKQAQARQRDALDAQAKALEEQMAARRSGLEKTMAANRARWVQGIVGRITGPGEPPLNLP
jgi:hypothetical protein